MPQGVEAPWLTYQRSAIRLYIAAALHHDDLRVFIQTADAGGGRSTARHTACDHCFYLAPSTIAAISAFDR